ncbi:hypothetical protein DH2020_026523 [Rehmannia glutinosa]|uniref:60S acidic ribosomal protein n=1 Tax=Rehmannia glutinosa TaxID=99300 RepID=A0ABR0VWS1_REHGL
MGVFTFVCKGSGSQWSAKQLNGDLEASADGTFDLQRKLVQVALSADSSGGVQSSFSYVTPSSAVFQYISDRSDCWWQCRWWGFIGGGAASAPAASGGGAASEAPPVEEKKEEKEESDDDMGFSLFD